MTAVERHNANNYFYYCIRSEGLLCDAERDLLVIAKFLVITSKEF